MFKLKNYSKKSIVLLVLAGSLSIYGFLFASANFSSGANRAFAQADDFPRGALVYAQFQDLPALVNLWNKSALKEKYLQSVNFSEFQNRHLALKLISRWQEFNNALGFELDAAKIVGATENRAAIAVYDIGKLEMVFIAPVANEKLVAATALWNQSQFEEHTLPDKTIYYSREVEADRGRQKQKIAFASAKGRFIIATSEDLLLKTLVNLSGDAKKNRLSDEPNFSDLVEKIEPHLATVWVDQTKLNEDWYFKHYWLMQNIVQLKNIRAGIFDFEMPEGKIVENRVFLMSEDIPENSQILAAEAEHLQSMIPTKIPYFKMQSVLGKPALTADLINTTLFEKLSLKTERKQSRQRWNTYASFAGESDDSSDDSSDYSYLGSDFDENIDEDETGSVETILPAETSNVNSPSKLEQLFAVADPSSVISVTDSQILKNPLFAEFKRAAVFNLNSPANFNQPEFEQIVLEMLQNRLGVGNANLNLVWETKNKDENSWRELNLPALGWGIAYGARENDLIVANNSELLRNLLENKNEESAAPLNAVDELTVINLSQREKAFDGIMKKLAPKKPADAAQTASDKSAASDFFVGNISSLLDTAIDVERIEITKNRAANYLTEEICFVLKPTK